MRAPATETAAATGTAAATAGPADRPAPAAGSADAADAGGAGGAGGTTGPAGATAAGTTAARPPAPRLSQLPRRVLRRVRHEVLARWPIRVRQAGWTAIAVSRRRGFGWLRHELADPAARHALPTGAVRIALPDAAALGRLAASGLLTGKVSRLRVKLTHVPWWQLAGLRPPRLARGTRTFAWRYRSGTLRLALAWSQARDVPAALEDALRAVSRARAWDQADGPVPALDRASWLDGSTTWPQGRLVGQRPTTTTDEAGRPLGPFLPSEPAPRGSGGPAVDPVLTSVANPFGRILAGTAAHYRLVTDAGGLELRGQDGRRLVRLTPTAATTDALAAHVAKYAVVSVDAAPADAFTRAVLRAWAACGMVFAASDATVRRALDDAGLVTVAAPAEVADLPGYALSVAASRRMAVTGDAALRRTALAGGALPLPTVSVVVSSKRPEHIEACLGHLATQTYPAFEVVLGMHGYDVPDATRRRWLELMPAPLRVVACPGAATFGAVLGRLSRIADGDLITKVDDDDRYGAHHITDLVVAWHTSGADVAAKGSRFVHFPETGETIDRTWTAPEIFNVTPAGGTLLLSRGTLAQVGGWSHSSRHVDTDLLVRVRSGGGLVYRTHGLEYVYVRRSSGHTWSTTIGDLAAQGDRRYPGLPPQILQPGVS